MSACPDIVTAASFYPPSEQNHNLILPVQIDVEWMRVVCVQNLGLPVSLKLENEPCRQVAKILV